MSEEQKEEQQVEQKVFWTTHRAPKYEHPSIWLLRLLFSAGTALAIFFTYKLAKELPSQHCKISPKMLFNIAVAGLGVVTTVYTTMLASGPWKWLRCIPFSWYLQIFLDFLMMVLYAAAAGTSKLTQGEICSACAAHGPKNIYLSHKHFFCPTNHGSRDLSPASPLFKRKGGGGHGGGGSRGGHGGGSGTGGYDDYAEYRFVTNICMAIAMLMFLCMTIYYALPDPDAATNEASEQTPDENQRASTEEDHPRDEETGLMKAAREEESAAQQYTQNEKADQAGNQREQKDVTVNVTEVGGIGQHTRYQ